MTDDQPTRGALRVCHVPQVPMKAFRVDVKDLREAAFVMNVLADYDLFQFQNNVKGDYCNVTGLEVFDHDWVDGEFDGWVDWHSTEGQSIKEHIRNGDDLTALVWEMDADVGAEVSS